MNVLIVDDEADVRELLTSFLTDLGHDSVAVTDGPEAIAAFDEASYDLVLLDIYLPGMNGIDVLQSIKQHHSECEVIMITAYGSISTAVEALGHGAYAYIRKPFNLEDLHFSILRVQQLIELRKAYQVLSHERLKSFHIDNLVATSDNMKKVHKQVIEAIDDGLPVLLSGERGTGKKFISRIIHFNGRSMHTLFVQVNPEETALWLDKQHIIHPDGIELSWQGFPQNLIQKGCGALLFNRLDKLPEQSQVLLAERLIQTYKKKSNNNGNSGVRIIATMESSSKTGVRKNLRDHKWSKYFTHHLHLPPLRERRECIIPTAQMFLHRIVLKSGRSSLLLSRPVQDFMQLYDWPANLSELQHLLERVAETATSRLLTIKDLRRAHKDIEGIAEKDHQSLENMLTFAEKQAIQQIFQARK